MSNIIVEMIERKNKEMQEASRQATEIRNLMATQHNFNEIGKYIIGLQRRCRNLEKRIKELEAKQNR